MAPEVAEWLTPTNHIADTRKMVPRPTANARRSVIRHHYGVPHRLIMGEEGGRNEFFK